MLNSECKNKEKMQIKKWKIFLLSAFIIIEIMYWLSLPYLSYFYGLHIPFMSNSGLALLLLNLRIYASGFMSLMTLFLPIIVLIIFLKDFKILGRSIRICYSFSILALVFVLFLGFSNGPKRDLQYMRGFLSVIEREVNISAVRDWMTMIEFPQEESHSQKIEVANAPEFIRKLNPNSIIVTDGLYYHHDPSLKKILYLHFGSSSANLAVGSVQMTIPKYFQREKTIVALPLEPGAYVFSPGAR